MRAFASMAFTVANGRVIVDNNKPGQGQQPTSFFVNAGGLLKTAGTAATTIGVAFVNQGALNFNGTTISFGETVQQTAAAAVTYLSGGTMTLTWRDPTFYVTAGELTGAAGATLAATRLLGAKVVPDGRTDDTVDLVLGNKFTALSAPPKIAPLKTAKPTLSPTNSCF